MKIKKPKATLICETEDGLRDYEFDGFFVVLDLNLGGKGLAHLSISNAPVKGKRRDERPTLADAGRAAAVLIPGDRDLVAHRGGTASWHLVEQEADGDTR